MTPPGVWAPRYHTGNAGRVLAQQHDQARINCRKLNGKDKNTHIKKTNPSSLACLWMPATVFVIFINFPSCLMSSDNYHSQAINTPLMVSSWAEIANWVFLKCTLLFFFSKFSCLCKEKHRGSTSNQQTKPSRAGDAHSPRHLLVLPAKHPHPPLMSVLMSRDAEEFPISLWCQRCFNQLGAELHSGNYRGWGKKNVNITNTVVFWSLSFAVNAL